MGNQFLAHLDSTKPGTRLAVQAEREEREERERLGIREDFPEPKPRRVERHGPRSLREAIERRHEFRP